LLPQFLTCLVCCVASSARQLFEFLLTDLESQAEAAQDALEESAGPGIGSVKALNAKLNTDLNGATAPVAGLQAAPAMVFGPAGPIPVNNTMTAMAKGQPDAKKERARLSSQMV
jgi:hypothetical protein